MTLTASVLRLLKAIRASAQDQLAREITSLLFEDPDGKLSSTSPERACAYGGGVNTSG